MNANLLNLMLIIVFVVMIVAALLGGLIGFVKGIYKTTLKTIVKSVLVLVLIFITPALANAIGNINIQGILQTATATTIHSWIAQQITNSGLFSPINGLSLYASAIALANSILAYATFFLGAILIQILASPLTALLYNGIFRWISPVETNKERKGDGRILNTDNERYNYISYNGCDLEYTTGTIIVTYLMYNPNTNYEDDIIERYDYILDKNFED